ncbi:MAG: TorF family putative porin [bacterium]
MEDKASASSFSETVLYTKGIQMKSFMKFLLVVAVSSVCFANGVRAEDSSESGSSMEVTYSAGVYSRYLGQWSGYVFDKRPSIQGDIGVSFANGIYLDIWSARQIGAKKDGVSGNEVDFTVGYATEVLGLSVDTSLTYYDLSPVLEGRRDNVWAPVIKVSKDFGDESLSISPFVRMEVDIPDAGSSFSGGMYLTGGAEAKISLLEDLSLCLASYFTLDDGAYDGDQNVIFGQTASLQYEIGDWILTLPSFLLTTPIESDSCRKTETCFGFSVEGKF